MSAVSRRLKSRRIALAASARTLSRLLIIAAVVPLVSAAPASPDATGRTIGLAVTDTKIGIYETADGKEECPEGLQYGEVEQWKAMDRIAMQTKFGGNMGNRGPNGELSHMVPDKVVDPLPWREYKATKAIGINLDGTDDGHATAKTCKHEKFAGLEGGKVDNQMQRVLGCVTGFRKTGFNTDFISKDIESQPVTRVLIEISGVNDEKNDPSVDVTIYKGLDRIVRTTSGKAWVPYMSHRIDERFPQYISKTHGRIVDGVLITDPIPMSRMPVLYVHTAGERRLRDMVLRLKLGGDEPTGTMSGYEPVDTFFAMLRAQPGSGPGIYSPPSVWRALRRNADGYPDPKTKQCTAISTSYKVSTVRALIAHDIKTKGERIAMAQE